MLRRASASESPGSVLSQAPRPIIASNMWPRPTSSTESAITSREMSEVFMPSVPIVTPSEMATVLHLHRRAAGGLDALLDRVGQGAQTEVAGHRLDPGVGDQDHRLLEILVGQADALEHRPGAGALDPVEDVPAHVPHVECPVAATVAAVCARHARSPPHCPREPSGRSRPPFRALRPCAVSFAQCGMTEQPGKAVLFAERRRTQRARRRCAPGDPSRDAQDDRAGMPKGGAQTPCHSERSEESLSDPSPKAHHPPSRSALESRYIVTIPHA